MSASMDRTTDAPRTSQDMVGRGAYRAAETPTFDPASTVLLVIDPVNDFLSEGGAGWEMTKSTVKAHDVVGHLRQAIDAALPHKGTDVFETDLPHHLQRLGTAHLVIAGMTANLCCESTGRRAAEKGYDVTFLSDAIGAENMVAYEASIRVNYPLVANAVMKVEEFVAALTAPPHGGRVAVGDRVTGSDRGSIGTVEAVLADAEVPHMRVSSGVLGLGDKLYIPLDAVVQRAGSEVVVNIPKLVAAKMPWHEPPTAQTQRDKQGPPLDGVAQMYGSVHATGDRSATARLD